MTLTKEWQRRVDYWKEELTNHFYHKLGSVEMAGYTTREQLSAEEALQGNFKPMPPGTGWGAKWEYGWFQGELTLPETAAGEKIVLKVNVGGESAVFINGEIAGAKDYQHSEILLTDTGDPGQQYQILVESYAGHGPRNCHAGPTPPDRETVPEPGPEQVEIGDTSFGIWQEEVYQLWLDVETLYQLRNNLDENSLRLAEIDEGLRDFTVIVDFEVSRDRMLATIKEARERLQPLLACVNGSTAPIMFTFGHAHIDVAWLWPLAETERKCLRTFGTQLKLMEQYPEYKFLQSQPHLYRMVKNKYPELYQQIKEAVKSGQFIPEGGMWVEADTNISGGESLIRQFIHGKRFFEEEFGVESKMLWLPDVFGYSGALPQIMQGCGIDYFATAKIFWNYNGGAQFPYNTFTWEGIDGSEVLVHLCNDYNSKTEPNAVIERWQQRVQKDGISTRLFPFGWGDGGGGPTRNHLEYLQRQQNLEGVPKTRMAHPLEYYHDQEKRGIPEARYVGELYFQAHRGTYTSQAKTKKGNRKSELALREAEMWGVMAEATKGFNFPLQQIDEAWKTVLLNQFHDILPGSSIERVYKEAEADYREVISTAGEVTETATSTIVEDSEAVTVFNSLSWDREVTVALPDSYTGAVDGDGDRLSVQNVNGKLMTTVEVPACGWTTIYPAGNDSSDVVQNGQLVVTKNLLENEKLRLELNNKGEITSIYDKEKECELTAGACNSFKMYKDIPTQFDAWDIDSMYSETPVTLDDEASVEVITDGPLVAKIQVKRKLHQSEMTQVISLEKNSRKVDFDISIDWQESHKLLKVAFPVNYYTDEALHEIQFGHLTRPNHDSRQFDKDRFEVCNHKWSALTEANRGFAVLNDSKYGISADGNCLNLTLLKSAMAPDMRADKGLQEFTYSFYAWNGSFAASDVVRKAYELNCPPVTAQGKAGEGSLFSVSNPDIIIETVKPAEDGSGDIVVRLYESKRTSTNCLLSTSLPVNRVQLTDMLENNEEELAISDDGIELDFTPFEIKTVRLQLQ